VGAASSARRWYGLLWLVLTVGILLSAVTLPPREGSPVQVNSITTPVPSGIVTSHHSIEPQRGIRRPSPVPAQSGVQAYQRGDIEGAAMLFREAVEQNPRDAESLNNLGQALVRLGDPSAALDYFDQAIRLNDRKWSYRFNRARAAGLVGDWPRAIAEYRAADELFPDDHVTLFNLSLALQHAGGHEEANELLRRAAALAPDEPSVHYALGLSEERLGRRQDAAAHYRRYLSLDPTAGNAPAVRARADALAGSDRPDSHP
jgi:tetratricopeptide (TPR) repeat protein